MLEDYTAAIPLLKRLLEIQPSVENVGNLADVYAANGSLAKAAEVYRDAVNAEWSGASLNALVKGLVDALDKDGRYGLSLEYVKKFREKGQVDDVDGALLEARVYSGVERALQRGGEGVPGRHRHTRRRLQGVPGERGVLQGDRQAGRRGGDVSAGQGAGAGEMRGCERGHRAGEGAGRAAIEVHLF